ncbi:MerR family transcriptional regulator [Thermoactinomyces mirandus]|uniref:MerR family transcriptional regulator n=1 Tax=Thermoactinomyces mirandus TaxID=2756294 RepID=A0A7W2AS58_9BACL|nr:MerR family transcriptional regulator [Thermoactinomyces mirandus]MBA4603097.1 MerR family transcriptional regulator [Thermoactinomyces mirandus]
MAIRPVDIARKLGISTTTLRKYEKWGLTPPVPRSATRYREYTDEHVAYFICLREMLHGFTLKQIAEIFREVMALKTDTALWMANKAQADLHRKKRITEKIVQNFLQPNNSRNEANRCLLTINDVSRETGIPVSTIRYWDQVGLISARRCSSNHYRMFTDDHVRQVLAIYALKLSVFANGRKHSIRHIREELREFNPDDRSRIMKMTETIRQYLNQVNRAQIRGISALYHLCRQVETNQFDQHEVSSKQS